jgi:hypothetical protein
MRLVTVLLLLTALLAMPGRAHSLQRVSTGAPEGLGHQLVGAGGQPAARPALGS